MIQIVTAPRLNLNTAIRHFAVKIFRQNSLSLIDLSSSKMFSIDLNTIFIQCKKLPLNLFPLLSNTSHEVSEIKIFLHERIGS